MRTSVVLWQPAHRGANGFGGAKETLREDEIRVDELAEKRERMSRTYSKYRVSNSRKIATVIAEPKSPGES